MSQAAEVITYLPRKCEVCKGEFTPKYAWIITCSEKCRGSARKSCARNARPSTAKMSKNIRPRLRHGLRSLKRNLQKCRHWKPSALICRRSLSEAKEELAALEAENARLKEEAKTARAKPEPISRSHENGKPTPAKKTDAAVLDKAVEEVKQAYSKPLREVSPDTLPKRKLRICKNCGDEFDSRDRLEEFCCTQCRLEARQAGIE